MPIRSHPPAALVTPSRPITIRDALFRCSPFAAHVCGEILSPQGCFLKAASLLLLPVTLDLP